MHERLTENRPMQVTRPLYSLANLISRHTGVFTKKQCADVAARVGKELVDMEKAGIKIDKNACMYVAKKHVPQTDFELFWGNEDIMNRGEAYMKIMLESPNNKRLMGHYSKRANSMFLVDNITEKGRGAEVFAHEFQHYVYDNLTPVNKLLDKIFKFRNAYNSQTAQIAVQKSVSKPTFERNLRRLLETSGSDIRNKKELLEYFAKNTNITSEKRLKAYITSILRYHYNEDASIGRLLYQFNLFKNEINSYKAEDAVIKYKDKAQEGFMRIAELYKETLKVIRRELLKRMKPDFKFDTKVRKRNLPSPVFE